MGHPRPHTVRLGMRGRSEGDPVVALNHAVAVAMVHGPERGLERLEVLAGDARLQGSHRWEAARAHLWERAGRLEDAVDAYQRAAARTANEGERAYLLMRASRLVHAVDDEAVKDADAVDEKP